MGCGGPPVLDLDCLVPLDSRRSRGTAGLREPLGQIVAWMSDASGLLRKNDCIRAGTVTQALARRVGR